MTLGRRVVSISRVDRPEITGKAIFQYHGSKRRRSFGETESTIEVELSRHEGREVIQERGKAEGGTGRRERLIEREGSRR